MLGFVTTSKDSLKVKTLFERLCVCVCVSDLCEAEGAHSAVVIQQDVDGVQSPGALC